MSEIVTDLSVPKNWIARRGFNNQFTLTFLDDGDEFDISAYTFTLFIRKPGGSTNLISLSQGTGLTNGGATGILTVLLTAANSITIDSGGYYFEIDYSLSGTSAPLMHGIFNLVDQLNDVPTSQDMTVNLIMEGTQVQVNITLLGGSGTSIQFQDEGTDLGNNSADTVDFVGAGVTATRTLDKITVTIPGGGAVDSVTGDGLDNTDPANPVIDLTTSRTVIGTDSIVQTDSLKTIYFNSGSPFNFTIDQLTVNSETAFVNIGAGVVTFVAGAGVTISGVTSLPGSENATAVILYRTATNPVIVSGGGSGVETVTGDGVDNTDPDNPVLSFPTPSEIGLGNVNNTSDSDKPISTAQAAEFTRIENLIGKSDLGSAM